MKEKLIIGFWQRIILRFFPNTGLRQLAGKMKIKNVVFDKLHEALYQVDRVDIFPLGPQPGRGFVLILDQETALFFYQDGDHFKYDGFEMGEYEKGEVTVLDGISQKNRKHFYPD